jgi:hypothetical protein
MARPVYPHELVDPDFQWLVNTYKESHPEAVTVDSSCLPVVLILIEEMCAVVEPSPDAIAAVSESGTGTPRNDTDFPD